MAFFIFAGDFKTDEVTFCLKFQMKCGCEVSLAGPLRNEPLILYSPIILPLGAEKERTLQYFTEQIDLIEILMGSDLTKEIHITIIN